MEIFIFWLIGWLIWAIGYYVYKVYIDGDIWTSKRLIIWRGFVSGIISWFGIIVVMAVLITYSIAKLNNWIENKLA